MIRVFESASAAARLEAGRQFVRSFAASQEVLVLSATREAADDFVRETTLEAAATFGLHRFSLTQLAARLAAGDFATQGAAPSTPLGLLAVAVRSTFEARLRKAIPYFEPVAQHPGFPAALARSLRELRLAGVRAEQLAALEAPGPDLAVLLRLAEEQLEQALLADTARLFSTATRVLEQGREPGLTGLPVLLLDVAIDSRAVLSFVNALAKSAPQVFFTLPAGDTRTAKAVSILHPEPWHATPESTKTAAGSLERLGTYLFSLDVPPESQPDEQVRIFSAPGEVRECVEIARRILEEAQAGVPFDRMAVLLRKPGAYTALLETALDRAGVPAYFTRGSTRPNPAGRAFLALLACAREGYSASRFAEYLSLGQVPTVDAAGEPPRDRAAWEAPRDEAFGESLTEEPVAEAAEEAPGSPAHLGTLRAPWKWEHTLVEAAVIGGADRWRRRLDGYGEELRDRVDAVREEEPDSPRLAALEREIENLEHLRRFALPMIDALETLPREASWREWLAGLERLAPMALRFPESVLEVLAELRVMQEVGPVTLEEVHHVLADRLSTLESDPPPARFGRVFVGAPEHARGRSFDVVFVPGLAERSFPQKLHEDPLLPDRLREKLSSSLETQAERGEQERLLLRLAAGAAQRRLYVSYPRIEAAESRPRVPSFYALDVQRATSGRIDIERLAREAETEASSWLAWPAPDDPLRAIDDLEHDLAVLGPLLRETAPAKIQGRARYLLELNPHIGRSLRTRLMRWKRDWSQFDGLCTATDPVRDALVKHRLSKRAYSVSALQRFATCPYQFLLAAIHRLEPREEPASLEHLDPLQRGSIFHWVQEDLMHHLQARSALPVTPDNLATALQALDESLERIAERSREELAPAIDRVWKDDVEALRTDLRGWLHKMAEDDAGWVPSFFEFSFGLPLEEGRDSHSSPNAVTLQGGYRLHGIVDMIEASALASDPQGTATLRVTDHKTGSNRTRPGQITGGGEILQPVLYGMAVEAVIGKPVTESRLFFCTTRGQFSQLPVPLDGASRKQGLDVLHTIDRAVENCFLPPAPREGACAWCNFQEVCGPYEELRSGKKDQSHLVGLTTLRGMP